MKLLLIGSTGSPYYKHCEQEIRAFLSASSTVGIVSAANAFDEKAYFRDLKSRFNRISPPVCANLLHVRWDSNWRETLGRADALIIPGGNTYLLLKRLQESHLLPAIRESVCGGLPYIGSSAGANVLGPNILTTNDWNVAQLRDFFALGLVPFNINPHYIDDLGPNHEYAETRELRIREYHRFWNNPVLGLPETAVMSIADSSCTLLKGKAKVFLPNSNTYWIEKGVSLPRELMNEADQRYPGTLAKAVFS
jgi:dipeptidase E